MNCQTFVMYWFNPLPSTLQKVWKFIIHKGIVWSLKTLPFLVSNFLKIFKYAIRKSLPFYIGPKKFLYKKIAKNDL